MIAVQCCETCGAPFELQRKFDGGRGTLVAYPTCTCEEDATDAEVEELIRRVKAAREKDDDANAL